jgi:hypothetical protein
MRTAPTIHRDCHHVPAVAIGSMQAMPQIWILFLLVAFVPLLGLAQELQISKGWRAPQFKQSRDERIQVAKDAIAQLLQNATLPTGMRGMLSVWPSSGRPT